MYRFYVRGGGGVGVGAGAVHCPRAFAKHEQFAGLVAEIGQGDSFLQRPLALKTLFEGFVGGQSFPFTDVAVVVAEQKRRRKEREVDRERKEEKRQTNKHEYHATTTSTPQYHHKQATTNHHNNHHQAPTNQHLHDTITFVFFQTIQSHVTVGRWVTQEQRS